MLADDTKHKGWKEITRMSEYCCCNTAKKKGIKCPIHNLNFEERIRYILKFPPMITHNNSGGSDYSEINYDKWLSEIKKAVVESLPEKKEEKPIPYDANDPNFIYNCILAPFYNQALDDVKERLK